VLSNPEIHYQVARARLDELVAEAARNQLANEARRAADFVPANRLRDTAFWASVVGPLAGVGFIAYFVQETSRGLS
jgi:hypothetical protein